MRYNGSYVTSGHMANHQIERTNQKRQSPEPFAIFQEFPWGCFFTPLSDFRKSQRAQVPYITLQWSPFWEHRFLPCYCLIDESTRDSKWIRFLSLFPGFLFCFFHFHSFSPLLF